MLYYQLSMPWTSNFQLHYCFVEYSYFVWWHGRIHEHGDFPVSLSGYISHKNKQKCHFFWLRNMPTRRMSLVVLLHHVFLLAAWAFVCCTLIHRFCGNTLDFSSKDSYKVDELVGFPFPPTVSMIAFQSRSSSPRFLYSGMLFATVFNVSSVSVMSFFYLIC